MKNAWEGIQVPSTWSVYTAGDVADVTLPAFKEDMAMHGIMGAFESHFSRSATFKVGQDRVNNGDRWLEADVAFSAKAKDLRALVSFLKAETKDPSYGTWSTEQVAGIAADTFTLPEEHKYAGTRYYFLAPADDDLRGVIVVRYAADDDTEFLQGFERFMDSIVETVF